VSRLSFRTGLLTVAFLLFYGVAAFSAQAVWRNLGPSAGINISALAIDPQKPSVLYAGVGDRIFKSTDGGSNWFAAGTGWPQGLTPIAFAVYPPRPTHIYAASSRGVYKTSDGGVNWVKTPSDIPDYIYYSATFALDPRNENVLYAGTYSGVFKSTDGGANWEKISPLSCRCLAVDPQNPEVIFLGGYKIFYKSVNAGVTWNSLPFGYLDSYGYYSIEGIAVDPTSSDTVYALTPLGIYRSLDGGAGWSQMHSFGGMSYTTATMMLAIDPLNPQILYVEANEAYWSGSPQTARCLQSRDGGRTWTTLWEVTSLSSFPFKPHIILDPQRSLTIFETFPGEDGIRRSYDGGATWQITNNGLSRARISICDLDFSSSGIASGLYAVNRENEGILKSENGGAGWVHKNNGLGVHAGDPYGSTTVDHLTPDPRNPATAYIITNWYYYKGGSVDSLYKSSDGGDSWIKVFSWPSSGQFGNPPGVGVRRLVVDPGNSSTLYVATNLGVQKSTDGGTSWQEMNAGLAELDTRDIVAHPQTAGLLFAGTAGGVFKSTDGGANWIAANSGLENRSIRVLLLTTNGSTALYAGTDAGVFKSADLGATWVAIVAGLGNLDILALAAGPANPSILYAGTNGGGVYRSAAGGVSWTAFNDGLEDLKINCLGVDPVDSTRVYVGTDTGVYSTFDPPRLSLSPNHLHFGQVFGQASPAPRAIQISNAGQGTLNWSASGVPGWIRVSPVSGIGEGRIMISLNTAGLQSGSYAGTITISDPAAADSPRFVYINLEIYAPGTTRPPFGYMDTPLDGLAGIEGSIPVTGWALDDVGVAAVKIYRDRAASDPDGSPEMIYLGDAVFVEGARPDVELAYPNFPMKTRAGYGYMMLTNFLPNQGNGTFRIHAVAVDQEGQSTFLGTKTIACDNASAVLPFGAIDIPAQGGTASGSSFLNFAWVLTPMPKMIPPDGSTITAWVDGLPVGQPSYGYYRVDIATLFPGYANANGAIGFIPLDTTKYPNGVHAIVWSATDSAGVNNGFGSRFFTILNAGPGGGSLDLAENPEFPLEYAKDLKGIPADIWTPVYTRRGFGKDGPAEAVYPGPDGVGRIDMPEVSRIAVYLNYESAIETREESAAKIVELNPPSSLFRKGGDNNPFSSGLWKGDGEHYAAYQIVGGELRPLPIGASFDTERGVLYWQPGPGFLGEYDFVFATGDPRSGRHTKAIKIVILPTEKHFAVVR